MNLKSLTIAGILAILLGVAAFVHPRIMMPAKKDEVQIGPMKTIVETRRIIEVPPILSGLALIAGCGLIYLGRRKP